MSGEPVAIFLNNVLNDEKKKKKHNKQTTTKEERKKLAEMNECYYLRENHEKELLLIQWICKYYDARPEYSHFIRRIIQSKVQAKRKEQQQQQPEGKAMEQNLLLLKTLNTLLCKKKIRGVHNRHATLPSQYNLCYFIENAEHNEYIPINLLDSYYRELRHYQTRYFDGFRDRQHRTSLARLNYWKWVNDIKLLERMSDIEQLIRRLEGTTTTTTTSSKHTKQQKKRKRNENQVDENKKREETKKEIYLFHHPQYLTLPQIPTGLTRITLDPKLEERILLSCPLYATAPLTF